MFFADLEGGADDARVARGARRSPRARRGASRARVVSGQPVRAAARLARRGGTCRTRSWPGAGAELRASRRAAGGRHGSAVRSRARTERLVRADQRVHGPPRHRARAEGPRRDHRARRLGAPLREPHVPAAARHPPGHLHPRPARRAPPQDHAARRLRARPLGVPVLRLGAPLAHRRPRDPALEGRRVHAGTTSSRAARPATAARATGCPSRHAPRRRPKAPRATIFVHVATPRIPAVWQQYLAAA